MEEFKQYQLEYTNENPQNEWGLVGNVLKTDYDLNVKNIFITDDNGINSYRGFRYGYSKATSSYVIRNSDCLVAITNLGVAPTITLPLARVVGPGKFYIIKDFTGSATTTTITIVCSGTELVNGDTSTVINTNYGSRAFFTDGLNWSTLNNNN